MNRLMEKIRWKNLRINQKSLINLSVVLILSLASTAASAFLLMQSLNKVDHAGAESRRVTQITEIGAMFRQKDTRVVDYMMNPGDAAMRAYTQDQQTLTRAEKSLMPYMRTAEQKKILKKIMWNDSMSYNLFQSDFSSAVLMNDMKKAAAARQDQNKLQADTNKLLQQLKDTVIDEELSAVQSARSQILLSITFLSLSIILSIIVSAVITMVIQRGVSRSMKQAQNLIDSVSSGDLRKSEIILTGKDEISLITRSIDKMKQDLLRMIETIFKLSDTTKNSSRRLIHTAENVSEKSRSVKETMQELSGGIQNQAASTSRISDITHDFIGQLERETAKAGSIHQLSLSVMDATGKGRDAMTASIDHMAAINNSISDCMGKMKGLQKRMSSISSLVDLIEEISGQTNLLALNASIEAARAGKEGKGFTVIANSIRGLSNRITESVKEITEKVKGINTDSEKMIEALSLSHERSEQGTEQIQITGRQFMHIDKQMQSVGGNIQTMSERLQEVSRLGQNMKQSIESIAAVSEESAASVGEVSASMDNISGTMDQFSKEAVSLAEDAKKLDLLLKHFKL